MNTPQVFAILLLVTIFFFSWMAGAAVALAGDVVLGVGVGLLVWISINPAVGYLLNLIDGWEDSDDE